MTKTFEITATTTDEAIDAAIPFIDMREEARLERDTIAALDDTTDAKVYELHLIDGVTVLFHPDLGCAVVNEMSPDAGDSLFIEARELSVPEEAVARWRGLAE
ncbi:hypothetical protein L1787_00200 [Acuticoccus sp. M5D2P5]|uniref:hypothetical protein n=1 Tax=Acuticoccus kalidii TaxID=2910977 RepID=UPI001F1E642F|nr:hypothetical protein [Acuticoccus kalidii]MCF3931831.1 hypothetical protein [Acuticoccus kalidii]